MRKTSMSREIFKDTYSRHLAQKITETDQTILQAFNAEPEQQVKAIPYEEVPTEIFPSEPE